MKKVAVACILLFILQREREQKRKKLYAQQRKINTKLHHTVIWIVN
jgi:hypothetical protein